MNAQFLVECLDLPLATGFEGARWEPGQLNHLNCTSTFRIEDKARQIGWSFTVAAEAVANALLQDESTIFVSINQDEAKEKVRYARLVYDNLNLGGLPPIIRDNELALEFAGGARIISLPSRPPRGKARMNIVLDEFAHVQQDKEIYRAAMPIISRGGRLRIGSSPLGGTGRHWEVSQEQLRAYPGYVRVTTPWWKVRAFCKDGILPTDAEEMITAQRVERYGNERIQALFANLPLDDFQQEHECLFCDESVSWIPWELIRRNQKQDLLYWHTKDVDTTLDVLPEIHKAVTEAQIEQVLVGGVDIGRKKHLTEIVLVGLGQVFPIRLMVSLDRVRYDDQEACIRSMLTALPIKAMLIDQNGIGNQLAEDLGHDTIAEGITFTNATKELWAVEAKLQLERGNAPLPMIRDLAYQIHSIKKKITAAKNNVFDTERNEKHHADKFWGWALALWAAREHGLKPQWGKSIVWRR